MIELDGSRGEGGGQILRSALTLSLLSGQPFKLVNIRANRPKPGLAAQHLACIRAAAAISSGVYKGGQIGSSTLYFEPGKVKAGDYSFAIQTAGATALVLHTVFLPLALSGNATSRVSITGGTHVAYAPSFDFLEQTWAAWMRKLGLTLHIELKRHGFYPRGGGEIAAQIEPCSEVRPLQLMDGPTLATAGGFAAVADLSDSIAKTLARRLKHKLKMAGIESEIDQRSWENGPAAVASVIFRSAVVPTLFCALGERGRPSELVADDAVEQAVAFRDAGAPVDEHSADQIVLPLACGRAASEFRVSQVTPHLRTNLDTIRRFVNREMTCEGPLGEVGTVRIAAKS